MKRKDEIAQEAPARIVLCLGLKSSGSTWLYNVVSQVLENAARPRRGQRARAKTVQSFYADTIEMFPKIDERAHVLVIKCHIPSAGLLLLTRLMRGIVIVTVREPRDAIVSLMQRFGHPFESSMKDVAQEAAQIVEIARAPETRTLRYEDRFYEDVKTVSEIAALLGVRISRAAQKKIYQSLRRDAVEKKIEVLKSKGRFGGVADPDRFDPKTQWHPGHVGDGKIGKYAAILSTKQQHQIIAATKSYCRKFGYSTKENTKRRARPGKRAKRLI